MGGRSTRPRPDGLRGRTRAAANTCSVIGVIRLCAHNANRRDIKDMKKGVAYPKQTPTDLLVLLTTFNERREISAHHSSGSHSMLPQSVQSESDDPRNGAGSAARKQTRIAGSIVSTGHWLLAQPSARLTPPANPRNIANDACGTNTSRDGNPIVCVESDKDRAGSSRSPQQAMTIACARRSGVPCSIAREAQKISVHTTASTNHPCRRATDALNTHRLAVFQTPLQFTELQHTAYGGVVDGCLERRVGRAICRTLYCG